MWKMERTRRERTMPSTRRLAEHMKADPHDPAAKDAYDKLLIPKGFFNTPKAEEIYEEGLRLAADPSATSAVQQ